MEHEVQARDRLIFYASRYVSQMGQGLFLAALLLASGTGRSGPLGLSAVFAAMLAASVVLGLPGGALVDRLGAERGLVLGAALRLGAIGSAVAIISHPASAWIAALAFSAASQLFSPAELALVPRVQHGSSGRAHALLVTLQYAGQGTGALLTPPLLLLGGPRLALLAAIALYILLTAGTLVLALRLRRAGGTRRRIARKEFALGHTFRYFAVEPRALYAVALLAFTDVASKSIAIAAPLYLSANLGLGRPGIIALFAVGALGAGLGLLWSGRGLSLGSAPRAMRLALTGMVGAVALLVLLGHPVEEASELSRLAFLAGIGAGPHVSFAAALPLALLLGICISVAPIGARAVLTDTAPAGQQARVFATQATVSHAAVILPLLLAGAGTQLAGPRVTLTVLGVVGFAVLLTLERLQIGRRSPALAPVAVEADAI